MERRVEFCTLTPEGRGYLEPAAVSQSEWDGGVFIVKEWFGTFIYPLGLSDIPEVTFLLVIS